MATRTQHSVDVQIRLLTAMEGQLAAFGQQMTGLQGQANQMGRTFGKLFALHQVERFGRFVSGMFDGIIDKAAGFQGAMAKVAIATGATGAEFGRLNELILKQSSLHAMSTEQAASQVAVMARTGMSREAIQATFPTIAKFSDIEKMERGMDFEQSAKLGASVARFFGARTPEAIERVMNNLYRAMNMTPATPGELVNMITKFAPTAGKLGVSQEGQFQLAALMGTMGLSSTGGRGLMQLMIKALGSTATITAHRQKTQTMALERLGLEGPHGENASFVGGKFDPNKLIEGLIKAGTKLDPKDFVTSLVQAFGLQGTRLAAPLSSPAALENMREMQAHWGDVVDLQKAYEIEQGTLTYQTNVLATNFDSLQAVLGAGTLGPLAKFNAWLGEIVAPGGGLANFAKAHQTIATALLIGGKYGGKGIELAAKGAEGYIIAKMMAHGGALPVVIKRGGPTGGGIAGKAAKVLGAAGTGVAIGGLIHAVATDASRDTTSALGHLLRTTAAGRFLSGDLGADIYDIYSGDAQAKKRVHARYGGADPERDAATPDTPEEPKTFPALPPVPLEIHIHGTATDESFTIPNIRAAANRSSGSAPTTPSHAPASGFGSH